MDPWVVTPPERVKHDQQFAALGPNGGIITGDQAKSFLLQSHLPPAVLGKIWALADHDADGKMDANEFSVACKLITMKLKGFEVPPVLPPTLQGLLSSGLVSHAPAGTAAPPQPLGLPPSGAIGMAPMTPAPPMGMAAPIQPVAAPMGLSGPLLGSVAPVAMSAPLQPPAGSMQAPAAPMGATAPPQSPPSAFGGAGEWAVPQPSRLKYTQTFNQHDRSKSGYLSGPQARNVLMQSGLPTTVLAQIWSLCDLDQDGRLSCDEFVLAMHLCERTRLGEKLANTLPPELVPPSFRRARTTSTGSLPGEPAADAVTSPLSQAGSFEDRRRDNYNKGQAELERRRRLLEEAQKREQEERARKEREEQEKLERARQEQEQRRQEELERQQQRRRELEQQQEEARRREQEQREAARREMERKRRDEWEVQKRQELENQRQKQQELVLKLKAQNTSLTVQLSSATDRVKELTQQISDTRAGVTEVKATIDGMRATRDANMSQLTALKAQLRQHNSRLLQVNQERAQLEARNKLNDATNTVAAGLESTAMNYDSKQHIIEQLRQRADAGDTQCLEQERELAARMESLRQAKQMLNTLVMSCQQLYAQHEDKRRAVLQLRTTKPTTTTTTTPSPDAGPADLPAARSPQQQQQQWAADFDSPAAAAATVSAQLVGWPAAVAPPVTATTTSAAAAASPAQLVSDEASRKVPYRALYEFEGRSNDEVSFKPGDIVMINLSAEAEVSWLEGEVNGRTGWLPEAYVEPLDSQRVTASAGAAPNGTISTPTEVQPSALPEVAAERYVALFKYESTEPGDLVFEQGDLITVTEKHGEWWTGQLGSSCGIFPSNYVQLAEKRRGEVAVVIAPYEATSGEQLTLQRGQLLMVRKKSETGWWEGEIQMRGKQRQVGWFPASFVKLKTSRRMSLPDETEPLMPSAQCPGDAPAPSPGSKHLVVAQFAYAAQNDDELTFQPDDVITVVNKDDISWWKGELNGVLGLFPSNYVAEKPAQSPSSHQQMFSTDQGNPEHSPNVLLPDGEQGEAASEQPPLDMASLSEEERQRQGAISELVTSEEAYLTSLTLVTEVFRRPLVAGGLLSRQEARMLFVNWADLVKTSRKLAVALRVRRKMSPAGLVHSIGDILCENLPHMTSYLRFCSCQLRAATLLQRKVQLAEFDTAVRRCQSDARAAGMPLSSFLLKPTQRVTKYPLLIRQILKHTPVDHPDHAKLEEAVNRAEELCRQVNEGVREQQNSDRLEWLQERVDCSEIPETLVFNSLTNAVGPRRLLHHGLLNKTKSGREVVAFLFNDFLLLTTPSRQIGSIGQVEFDRTTSNLKFKLYKKPLLLGELEVTSSETEHALQLSCPGHVISLTASSRVARDLWRKQLTAAQTTLVSQERSQTQRQNSRQARFVACGRLLVVVMSANRLVAAGADGKSDPYCELTMGSQVQRTPVIEATLNPRWNHSMQFLVNDLQDDVLCISVFDRDHFSPNEFLGRTELPVADVVSDRQRCRGPVIRRLPLHEVRRGEVDLKLDLQLFTQPQ